MMGHVQQNNSSTSTAIPWSSDSTCSAHYRGSYQKPAACPPPVCEHPPQLCTISNPQTAQRMVQGEDPRPGPHHTVHEREVKVQDLGNNSTVQYSRPPPRVHRARLHFAAVPRLPLPSAAPVTWREGGVGGGARSARAMPPASAFSPLLAAEEEGGAADPAGRSNGEEA